MSTDSAIAQACDNLTRTLEAFRAQPQQLTALRQCLDQLQHLREEYRQDKAAFAPHVEKLRQLSAQVHEAIAAAAEMLAGQYLEAVAQTSAWQKIRETCRDALAELAKARKIPRFTCAAGTIEARPFQSMALPPAGSPARQALSDLITLAGRWPEVAYPTGPKLLKAFAQGLFSPEQAAQLTQLCPVETQVRLMAKGSRGA